MGAPFDSIGGAVWWAFLRLTDPGYLGDDRGFLLTSISTAVTIAGYVVFLGALVAIMTQWFNQTMNRLEAGLTKVSIKGHIVILGWTNRTPKIIQELFNSEGRVHRFLKRLGSKNLRVALMTKEMPYNISQDLSDRLGDTWQPSRLILRSGDHLKIEHLQRVAFLDAAVILLPSLQDETAFDSTIDGSTIKTLITINNSAKENSVSPPLVVAEIIDERKENLAKKAYDGPIEIVASETFLSRLIAQNLRNSGLSSVYSELLGHESGNEIYLRDPEFLVNQPFKAAFDSFPKAIPIGIIRTKKDNLETLLAPDLKTTILNQDKIIVISEDYKSSYLTQQNYSTNSVLDLPSSTFKIKDPKLRNILILGWNHQVPSILMQFDRYAKEKTALTIISRTPVSDRIETLTRRGIALSSVSVNQVCGDYTSPSDLKEYDPASFDAVLILASDWTESDASTDARTILGYMVLVELIGKAQKKPQILVELLNFENQKLLNNKICETIVSPVLVSFILTQVALRRELNSVFEELFGPEGAEINFIPCENILGKIESTTLCSAQKKCYSLGVICIGIAKNSEHFYTILNPERDTIFQLEHGDKFIVITNQ